MKFRSIFSCSLQFRTNMFYLILAVFCSLQSFIFCVIIQPKQSIVGMTTSQRLIYTCSREPNEADGILTWINPHGENVDENSMSGVYMNRKDERLGARLFFMSVSKRDEGEYKCQLKKGDKVLSSDSFKLYVSKSIDTEGNKGTYLGVEGDTLTIACAARFDPLGQDSQLSWTFGNTNTPITNGGQFHTKLTRGDPTDTFLSLRSVLTIKDLTKENEGLYICNAYSITPHVSEMKNVEINVRVQFRPHFPPNTPKYVWLREDIQDSPIFVNITCIVNADPVASFAWMTGDRIHIENGKLRQRTKVSSTENLSVLSVEYNSIDELKGNLHNDPMGNLKKFICQATNTLGSAHTTYELKVGKLPNSPIINNHVYNNGLLSFTLNESEIDPPIDIYRIEIADKQFIYFNATNKNPENNTYEIELDIPKGQHQMVIYAHNPVGWSQPPHDSIYLAVISCAFLAKQYLAFVIIGCTMAFINSF